MPVNKLLANKMAKYEAYQEKRLKKFYQQLKK